MKKIFLSLIAFCFFFFLPVFCPVSFCYDWNSQNVNPSGFTWSAGGRSYEIRNINYYAVCFKQRGASYYTILFYDNNEISSVRIYINGSSYSSSESRFYNDLFTYCTYGDSRWTSSIAGIPDVSSLVSDFSNIGDAVLAVLDYLSENKGAVDFVAPSLSPSDIGYLDDVQYFVDSYAYHNDTASTPEWVKWGSTSTTGIDLSDNRYQVEFMMEDKSTFLRNGANDSWLTQAGVPFASAVAFAESKLEYAASYLFPSGSDQRALLQGKAAKTSFYGKASGLGSVPASAGVYKFSVASQYKAALENDSSSDKGIFYNLISDILSNQGNVAEKFFNSYQASGKALNFSYDLYARIVDTSSGTSGNWLKIDRHNSPFEWSNNDRFLNGGVTASKGHRFINYNPETNIFKTLPDDKPVDDDDNPLPDGNPAFPVPVGTGYVDNSDNSIQNVYNNYNYTYNTFYDNDLFYTDLEGKKKDTGSGMIETIGILGLLGILWTWYLALFGDLLPLWAVVLVPVFGTLFVAFLVWKFGKGLMP